MRALDRHHRWLIALLLLLGAALRLWQIDFNALWLDEVFSQRVAVISDPLSIAAEGVAGDVHPPLYFMLLHGWVRLFGDGVRALRALSALLMIGVLPGVYLLARTLFNARTGLVALTLAVITPMQIYYAHEARQYALSVLAVTWAMVGLALALKGERRGWWLYGLGSLAGLYTHYFVGFWLAAVGLWLLLRRDWRSCWREWLPVHIVIAVLFLPQFALFLGQTQTVLSGFWIEPANPAQPIATLAFLLYGTTLPGLLSLLAILLVLMTLAVAVLDILRRAPLSVRDDGLLLLWLVLITLMVPLTLSLLTRPLYLDRAFSFLSPLLAVMLAVAVTTARRPSPAPLLVAMLAGLMLIGVGAHGLQRDPAKPPYDEVALDLMRLPNAEQVPVLHLHDSSYLPVAYYAPGLDHRLVNLGPNSWLLPATWDIFGVDRFSREELDTWLSTYDGALSVVLPAPAEAEEVNTLIRLRDEACQEQLQDYAGQVIVYRFQLGTCS